MQSSTPKQMLYSMAVSPFFWPFFIPAFFQRSSVCHKKMEWVFLLRQVPPTSYWQVRTDFLSVSYMFRRITSCSVFWIRTTQLWRTVSSSIVSNRCQLNPLFCNFPLHVLVYPSSFLYYFFLKEVVLLLSQLLYFECLTPQDHFHYLL